MSEARCECCGAAARRWHGKPMRTCGDASCIGLIKRDDGERRRRKRNPDPLPAEIQAACAEIRARKPLETARHHRMAALGEDEK